MDLLATEKRDSVPGWGSVQPSYEPWKGQPKELLVTQKEEEYVTVKPD